MKDSASIFGEGLEGSPIWLDGVSCDGDEPDLDSCKHNFIGIHDCRHSEDVGCRCSVEPPTLPGGGTSGTCTVTGSGVQWCPCDIRPLHLNTLYFKAVYQKDTSLIFQYK